MKRKKERIPSTRHDSRRIPCHIYKRREEKIVTFGCAPEKRRGKKVIYIYIITIHHIEE
jgi:hypothetical protein